MAKPTSTSNFGVSKRESHDAGEFYARFTPPELSADVGVATQPVLDTIFCADATKMTDVEANSVALVVTSPPYFAGKEYEQALGEGHIPATYFDYLQLLEDVFAECRRVLEPGGRIAVNVANLGRRPYRSLSADVIGIFERLGLLLRGEVIWQKARGASGSCAWGSFAKPTNPVLRDVTERVVIAGKGRFDRAPSLAKRAASHLPHETTLSKDEFMDATLDVWEIPSESARLVGHPAPFPVELPERLIHLNTFVGDVVLDPFMGSGTTAIAALRTGRHYLGYETDATYVARAEERIGLERQRLDATEPITLATRGRGVREIARECIADAGFTDIADDTKFREGVDVSFSARSETGRDYLFEIAGGFTTNHTGLRRADMLWKALGKAAVLRQAAPDSRLIVLTTDLPPKGSSGASALDAVCGPDRPILDVIDLTADDAAKRLAEYAAG